MAYLEVARRRGAKESGDSTLKKVLRLAEPHLDRILPVTLVILILAAWEGAARAGELSPIYFPAPSVIARALVRSFMRGELSTHTVATLRRLFLGVAFGGVPGLILGLFMGWSRRVRALLDPFIAAAHPIPKIALLPLIFIIFGVGEPSRLIVISVAAFFPILINTMAGVRQISPINFEVSKSYGANLTKVFIRVIVPGSLPWILTGVRLALNVALLVTIAVELVAAREGLGAMIWLARETMRTEELYASLFIISAMGFSSNFLLQHLATRFAPWQAEQDP